MRAFSFLIGTPFLVLLSYATPISAQEMFVFGDSYSLTRFSDGPVWHQYFTDRIERPNAENFAMGGAGTGTMTGLINRYLVSSRLENNLPTPDDLFAIWAGAADILLLDETDMSIPVSKLSEDVATLAEAGAHRIILGTLPLLGETDWGKSEEAQRGADLDVISRDFNTQLKSAAEQWKIDNDLKIFILDAFALHEEIINDPIGTGFPDPSRNGGLLLLDDVHFRTTFHELLSDQLYVEVFGADPGDFNENGRLDEADLDALDAVGTNELKFDLNADGTVDLEDRQVWVKDQRNTWYGDSNLDGEFNSSDLVAAFGAGQYEDEIAMNSSWATGDWNGDSEFDSADVVFAFIDGGYEQGPRSSANAVPEPMSAVLLLLGMVALRCRIGS